MKSEIPRLGRAYVGAIPTPMARLVPGWVHDRGIRTVTVDLGAHWQPGRHIRPPKPNPGADSAQAEVLAAAAHFPEWTWAVDRTTRSTGSPRHDGHQAASD